MILSKIIPNGKQEKGGAYSVPFELPEQFFEAYNKALPVQQALGSKRGKEVQEVTEIRSTNFQLNPDGSVAAGWRLTRRGLETVAAGVFPPGSITFTDIQNIATARILGRTTALSGVIEQLTAAQVKTLLAIVSGDISDFSEAAQDAVGGGLVDTNTVDMTYNDGANTIKADVRYQDTATIDLSDDASGLKASAIAYTVAEYAAGTAYSLTNSYAQLAFGTTSPAITIGKVGTYALYARVRLDYNGATFAAVRTVSLKLRRTNNTASDISNDVTSLLTQIVTAESSTLMTVALPVCIYTTANTNDALEIQGKVSTVPTAGNLDAVEAELIAVRLA